jgi:type II secretory pathway component HofQ
VWNEEEVQKPVKLTKEEKQKIKEEEAREAERRKNLNYEKANEQEESDLLHKIGNEVGRGKCFKPSLLQH